MKRDMDLFRSLLLKVEEQPFTKEFTGEYQPTLATLPPASSIFVRCCT